MHPGLQSHKATFHSALVQSNKISWLQTVILGGLGPKKFWVPGAPARKEEAAEHSQSQVSDLRLLASARRGWGDSGDSWWVCCQPRLATLLSAFSTDLSGKPGACAVCPLHHRQHLLRPAHRALRDGGGGCAEGQCPRLHHGAAGRVQHRYCKTALIHPCPIISSSFQTMNFQSQEHDHVS